MDIFSPTFGNEVKSKLAYFDISQKKLAEMVGKTQPYINDIINDKRDAPDIRRKIAAVLSDLESGCLLGK